MARIKKGKKHAGFLLLMLVGLGLSCLALPETTEGGVATAWTRFYHGAGNGSDYVAAMALDGRGNIYVTGTSEGSGSGRDYLTIKYSPHGKRLWARRYTGPGNNSDYAKAMAVDAQGNVYVTGGSLDARGSCATVKYSADGRLLWARRYKRDNGGQAIAVDSQGNIYVTGASHTIKYSPDGQQLWIRPFDVPRSSPAAMALDAQGNSYVLGSMTFPLDDEDEFLPTIKYSPNGELLWEAGFHTAGFDPNNVAKDIAVDAQGNCYVIGGWWGVFLTIKYSPEGRQLWARGDRLGGEYGEPCAVAADGQGNAYVSGTGVHVGGRGIGGYAESITIKYSADGQILWTRAGLQDSNASAMALDDQGNIYVTGNITTKYSPDGQTLWEKWNNLGPGIWGLPRAIAVDGVGNVYVSGTAERPGTGQDYVTIKYIQTPRTGR